MKLKIKTNSWQSAINQIRQDYTSFTSMKRVGEYFIFKGLKGLSGRSPLDQEKYNFMGDEK